MTILQKPKWNMNRERLNGTQYYVNRDGMPERFQIPIDKRIYVFEDVDCHKDKNNLVFHRVQKEIHCKEKKENPTTIQNDCTPYHPY